MDYRDLVQLYRESLRKSLSETLKELSTMRAAYMAKPEKFSAIVNELKNQMNQVQMGNLEAVKMNWADLKKRG